jgi:hypothetical protein
MDSRGGSPVSAHGRVSPGTHPFVEISATPPKRRRHAHDLPDARMCIGHICAAPATNEQPVTGPPLPLRRAYASLDLVRFSQDPHADLAAFPTQSL